MVLNSHYESCNNFEMVLNSHYESCNNFEMVMIFAEKHRTYDGIGMFIDQCKREAISNIFQTNKFNFSILYCCFYDGIGMFIDQCKREAISNIFQTNKFNFSILYCCFSLIQPFLLFSTLSSG